MYLLPLQSIAKKQEDCSLNDLGEPPPVRSFRDWKARFSGTLTVMPRKPVGDHGNRGLSTEKKEEVLTAFGDDPFTSLRKVAHEMGVAQSLVNKIFKE